MWTMFPGECQPTWVHLFKDVDTAVDGDGDGDGNVVGFFES